MSLKSLEEYTEINEEELKVYYSEWATRHIKLYRDIQLKYPGETALSEPISVYAGYGADSINAYLRNKSYCIWKDLINSLRTSILSAPRLPQKATVYRWVPKYIIKEMLRSPSRTYFEKGFLSTSLRPIIESRYTKGDYRLIRIKVDEKTPAVFVDVIVNRGEKELLFLDGYWLKYNRRSYNLRLKRCVYEVSLICFPIIQ